MDESGSEVVVFARNTSDDPARGSVDDTPRPAVERLPYAVVRRFSWLSDTPLFGLLSAPVPVNPFWTVWLLFQFYRTDIDVVVTGDIRSGIPTALAAKLLGIPVVLDLREHYVGLAESLPEESRLDRLAQHPRLVGSIEWATIRSADEVWVVVEERRDELVRRGVPPEKLTVVGNTPELADSGEDPSVDAEAGTDSFDWPGVTLVYVGVLNEFRGLDLVVDAVATLDREGDDTVHFAIAGEGPHKEQLERRVQDLDVTEHVSFTGWIDSERVPEFLASGDVGVIPHRVTRFTNNTAPNKLFDCMKAGLPVLTTDMEPVRRIVTEENCGYVLPPEPTPSDAASGVRELMNTDLDQLGANGRAAVVERYNWEVDAERVRESLQRLHRSS